MEIPLLRDIAIILALSVASVWLCHRLRVPPVVGFLLAGVIAGPYGLRLVRAVHEVETLAEIGVILLLFTIGIEFSLKSLARLQRLILVGGSLQVGITIAAVYGILRLADLPPERALFLGCLVSLSSTAIVLKILQERSEITSPQGRGSVSMLIFQDIIVVLMILVAPILGGESPGARDVAMLVAKSVFIVAAVLVAAQYVVPRILFLVTGTRSNELFLLAVTLICFAVAWLTSRLGLSLALGAFLAGLIVSASPYSVQALGNVLPLRDIFTSFFFVSIGMLLDLRFAAAHVWFALAAVAGVLVLKTVIATFSALVIGFPVRIAILVGLVVSQVGEFSFVLSRTGADHGLLDPQSSQLFIVVTLFTMAATPFIISYSHAFANAAARLPLPDALRRARYAVAEEPRSGISDHVVIVGFGVIGRNLAHSARLSDIPYAIIEVNRDTVLQETRKGERIYYGDAAEAAVLRSADIQTARVLAVTIPDPATTRRITEVARRANPGLYIIARTRFLQEMEPLYRIGANEVVPEEFEASVAIFSRVLRKYVIPRGEIERYAAEARADSYGLFRECADRLMNLSELNLPHAEVEINAFRLGESAPLVGMTVGALDARSAHGFSVVYVQRGKQRIPDPPEDMRLDAGDIVVVVGRPDNLREAAHLFEDSEHLSTGEDRPDPTPD